MTPAKTLAALALAALLAGPLAGCGGGRGSDGVPIRVMPVSPAGELLGPPAPSEAALLPALEAWFGRADTNGDGSLDRAEFVADADRAFAGFDTNRDGNVTAAELTLVRANSPFRPPPEKPSARLRPRSLTVSTAELEEPRPGQGGGDRPFYRSGADPVMAADTNADFRVTAEEQRAQAARLFDKLESSRDGRLSRAEYLDSERRRLATLPGW